MVLSLQWDNGMGRHWWAQTGVQGVVSMDIVVGDQRLAVECTKCPVSAEGLCNAPATFQRLMDVVLAGVKWSRCLVYIDDIVMWKSFHHHMLIYVW